MTLVLGLARHISAAWEQKRMGIVSFQFPLEYRDIDESEHIQMEKRGTVYLYLVHSHPSLPESDFYTVLSFCLRL
jgi:hypothetical protein